jgi:ectoine hydroxylase-related dioxygenase (phytanoyl-CoA dioxygenase family)
MPVVETHAFGESSDEQLLTAIERDGAVIIRNALTANDVAEALRELDPFIAGTGLIDDELVGSRTTRTGALAARSAVARAAIMHPDVVRLARRFLADFSPDIQLNLTQVMRLLPGQGSQRLHRDRFLWGRHLAPSVEPLFNTMWALTEFTELNGATRVVPGSHKWAWDREATPDETVGALMPAGSVLLYTGSVVHGGGANRSETPRIGMNITYLLGWLRQEENQYLSCPPAIAAKFEPELQVLLGYSTGNGALGYYSSPNEPAADQPDIRLPATALGVEQPIIAKRARQRDVF